MRDNLEIASRVESAQSRALNLGPLNPPRDALDINSLVGIIRQRRRVRRGPGIGTRRKTTFVLFTSGDFVSRKFVACLAGHDRLALILIDVDLAVVYAIRASTHASARTQDRRRVSCA